MMLRRAWSRELLLFLFAYALCPVAPPRLADIGLVDTITSQTGLALDSKLTTSLYNQYAAVPSLHAGFALAVSAALVGYALGRAVPGLGALHRATARRPSLAAGSPG